MDGAILLFCQEDSQILVLNYIYSWIRCHSPYFKHLSFSSSFFMLLLKCDLLFLLKLVFRPSPARRRCWDLGAYLFRGILDTQNFNILKVHFLHGHMKYNSRNGLECLIILSFPLYCTCKFVLLYSFMWLFDLHFFPLYTRLYTCLLNIGTSQTDNKHSIIWAVSFNKQC